MLEINKVSKKASLEGEDWYHSYGSFWWTNEECPYAYKYLIPDELYSEKYFDSKSHPQEAEALSLYFYMQSVYSELFGKEFKSILELGSGGGFLTKIFQDKSLDFMVVEGTEAGVQRLIHEIGISNRRIVKEDLRQMNSLYRKFDIVMCTEVAEHIEPWFASKIVENCIEHSDNIWFSAAKGTSAPHYHHPNEAPIEAWDNIFAFLDYNKFVKLDGKFDRADRLYIKNDKS